jgi:hypothetical protein
MTSGKRVQLPPAPELTGGPDLALRLPLPGDVDDIVAQCRDPEFQRWTVRGLLEYRGERRDGWIGSLRRGELLSSAVEEPPHGM